VLWLCSRAAAAAAAAAIAMLGRFWCTPLLLVVAQGDVLWSRSSRHPEGSFCRARTFGVSSSISKDDTPPRV
jgi:hypothetical protein